MMLALQHQDTRKKRAFISRRREATLRAAIVRGFGQQTRACAVYAVRPAVTCLPVVQSVKCLGVWWDSAPSSKKSVTGRIHEARAAFFSHGQFHGLLNPSSIVECCVLPVLMYGSESWVLNTALLGTLESFQAELGKHILKLLKFALNNIPLLVLNWPSMCARILCSKLS